MATIGVSAGVDSNAGKVSPKRDKRSGGGNIWRAIRSSRKASVGLGILLVFGGVGIYLALQIFAAAGSHG